ncbi:hypothetical protein HPB49_024624 [Dermacentor silvarum]|uniref:Uncharacterized protein n=1 Tax=Dermacentor silvarum TaxID=543639 RepID=A0ACB8CI83_DERSI|nr:hypothetical protein HPB49_024624 [Dermacentor silvarum]
MEHRRSGSRERNTLRLTQAYITNRTAYAFQYLLLKQKERDRINALVRSCTAVALRLPPSISTAGLFNLGTHNTFEELAEATLTAQFTRLSGTAAGRTLLCQLGITQITHPTEVVPLPPDLYSPLVIPPIPKNMHPEHDGKRRAARAKALHKQYGDSSEVAYVDVATYSSGSRMVLVVANNQEETIALALISTSPTKILSDSKSVLSNFAKGLVYGTAARLLRFWHPTRPVTLIWTAAHAGLPANEEVHSLARGRTFRAGVGPPPPALKRLLTFRDILYHYRDTQRIPGGAGALRGKPGDLLQVLLTCPTFPHRPSQTTAESFWDNLLASSTATEQRLIIAAALKRIALQGLSFAL